jgi:basic membrane lipoprotein Med (substrate-binding protein (PBP1-ABC) superfamily)
MNRAPVPSRTLLVYFFAFAAWAMSGCGGDRAAKDTSGEGSFRVALLLTGPISDDGWNETAHEGLLAIEHELGAKVAVVESLDKSKFEENLRQFGGRGFDLVFGHAYEFQDATLQVAGDFPKTTFIVIAGNESAPNVGSVHFRLEDATYVLGALSAKISKSNLAGLVGGEEVPSLKPGFKGFVRGAKSVTPDFRVITKYVGNWHDVALARELAEALVAEGCTTIFQNADQAGLGVFQAAAAHPGVYAFGSNKNQNAIMPDVILGSAVLDVPAAYLRIARAVKDGTYIPKAESMGAAEGVVRLEMNADLLAKLPAEIAPWVADLEARIRSGEIAVKPPAT